MKRLLVLAGLAAFVPSTAFGQIPVAPPPAAGPTAAPAASAPPAAGAASPAPAASPPPTPQAPPGDQYFVEPAPPPGETPPPAAAPPPQEPPPYEPPPPPGIVFEEPPPPPVIHHRAPQSSLWLGARLGWFFPFGNLWAHATPVPAQNGYVLEGVPWRDYASSGPLFELDAGMRLGRAYTVFGLWERAQLGSGSAPGPDGAAQDGAESDFWAIGLRAASNPDDISFLTEVAIGYRRARTFFKNDYEYQFTDAPFEARLGLGAELRLNRTTSLSGLATVGVGGFGQAESVAPNGTAVSLTQQLDEADGHAWVTLTVGAHFDLLPSRK